MASKRKIRFGIIGCGVIGRHHAKAIRAIEADAELVCVADPRGECALEVGGEYAADHCEDYLSMLERDDIDAVTVCTPSGMHADNAVMAAGAGKHVMVEKPIDVNLRKADLMIETCRKNKVKLGVIFQRRFSDEWRWVKKGLELGLLGDLTLGECSAKTYRSQEYYEEAGGWRGTMAMDGGACLINQGIHFIDLYRWLMGEPESVVATVDTLARDIEGEDAAVALFKFKNGALGSLQGATATYKGYPGRIELHGTRGGVICTGGFQWSLMGRDGHAFPPETQSPRLPMNGHEMQLLDFIDAIRDDREPFVNGEEGRKSLEMIRGVYMSSRLGREIGFPILDDAIPGEGAEK